MLVTSEQIWLVLRPNSSSSSANANPSSCRSRLTSYKDVPSPRPRVYAIAFYFQNQTYCMTNRKDPLHSPGRNCFAWIALSLSFWKSCCKSPTWLIKTASAAGNVNAVGDKTCFLSSCDHFSALTVFPGWLVAGLSDWLIKSGILCISDRSKRSTFTPSCSIAVWKNFYKMDRDKGTEKSKKAKVIFQCPIRKFRFSVLHFERPLTGTISSNISGISCS